MMRPYAKVEKIYIYPKRVDFLKSIDALAALVVLDIKAAVLFVVVKKSCNQVKISYLECTSSVCGSSVLKLSGPKHRQTIKRKPSC